MKRFVAIGLILALTLACSAAWAIDMGSGSGCTYEEYLEAMATIYPDYSQRFTWSSEPVPVKAGDLYTAVSDDGMMTLEVIMQDDKIGLLGGVASFDPQDDEQVQQMIKWLAGSFSLTFYSVEYLKGEELADIKDAYEQDRYALIEDVLNFTLDLTHEQLLEGGMMKYELVDFPVLAGPQLIEEGTMEMTRYMTAEDGMN